MLIYFDLNKKSFYFTIHQGFFHPDSFKFYLTFHLQVMPWVLKDIIFDFEYRKINENETEI